MQRPSLHPAQVDVHLFGLAETACEPLLPLLDAAERQRAARFRFARDRTRFIAAHAGLRMLLARYRGARPQDLQLAPGQGGKLRLADGPPLFFSLSRAGQMAAVAVSGDLEVGVDIEPVAEAPDCDELAHSICSRPEQEWIDGLPEPQRALALYRLWTIKEALVKAEGSGLSISPRDLSLNLAGPAPIVHPPTWHAVPWFAVELDPPAGYAAALATLRHPAKTLTLSHFDLAGFSPSQ